MLRKICMQRVLNTRILHSHKLDLRLHMSKDNIQETHNYENCKLPFCWCGPRIFCFFQVIILMHKQQLTSIMLSTKHCVTKHKKQIKMLYLKPQYSVRREVKDTISLCDINRREMAADVRARQWRRTILKQARNDRWRQNPTATMQILKTDWRWPLTPKPDSDNAKS